MTFAADLADALNSRELDRFDHMFAPDFTNHNPIPGPGVEGFKAFWGAMIAGMPDLHVTLEDTVVGDPVTAARYTLRGTHEGTFLGLAPTNRQVEMQTMEFWRFEDGVV